MKKMIFIVLCLLTACNNSEYKNFTLIDLINPELILQHKIKKITHVISGTELNKDSVMNSSGVIYNYYFNDRGLLVMEGLNRTGSYNYSEFDHNNQLIDIGWFDKSDSTKTSYFAALKDSPDELDRIKEVEARQFKITQPETIQSLYVDPCYSLNSYYNIKMTYMNELPIKGEGTKIEGSIDNSNHSVIPHKSSPKQIYIYYLYE